VDFMYSEHSILRIISAIRNSFPDAENVYLNGSCYRFYKILKTIFPDAEAYYDSNHVITKIGTNFYDITGKVKKEKHIPVNEFYSGMIDELDKMIYYEQK